jgi:hypothetical protein
MIRRSLPPPPFQVTEFGVLQPTLKATVLTTGFRLNWLMVQQFVGRVSSPAPHEHHKRQPSLQSRNPQNAQNLALATPLLNKL